MGWARQYYVGIVLSVTIARQRFNGQFLPQFARQHQLNTVGVHHLCTPTTIAIVGGILHPGLGGGVQLALGIKLIISPILQKEVFDAIIIELDWFTILVYIHYGRKIGINFSKVELILKDLNKIFPLKPLEFEISLSVESYDKKNC